jgi:hypothetical protein
MRARYLAGLKSGQITIVLIRISQWLALARGFPVVHLFCDIVRLFTIYGCMRARYLAGLKSGRLGAGSSLVAGIQGFQRPSDPCIIDLEHYDDQITIVLIRISQWLALARGFPVVHLEVDDACELDTWLG